VKELIPQKFLNFSRNLRTEQTPWEAKLWKRIRAGRFYGLKFKRQQVIENFIVDFYCHSKKLIIELDGGHHNEDRNQKLDHKRQEFLEKKNYIVLRFWNNEIDNNLDGVLEKVKETAGV
jgi:very-short-patch-repair endonuclease